MLKTVSSIVLGSSKSSTYSTGTPPVLLCLRPCWKAVLNILQRADAETVSNFVLGRTAPRDVPPGYASVAVLPAAWLEHRFEQP